MDVDKRDVLVSVCICTYKRNHLLQTLESVGSQILDNNIKIEIIVVDNDKDLSGKEFCNEVRKRIDYDLKYYSQPIRNLSLTRNESLKYARGDFVAFIDDDELADSYWLKELLNTQKKFDADVVFGWVEAIYPTTSPKWLILSRAFDQPRRAEGEIVTSGGSNCTLVRREFLVKHGLEFNLKYGKTGGEDADLFYRMHRLGAKLVSSYNATVSEVVADSRMNHYYVNQKAIRIGECYTEYRYADSNIMEKVSYFFFTISKLSVFTVVFVLLFTCNRPGAIRYRVKLLDSFGKLRALFCKPKVELYS